MQLELKDLSIGYVHGHSTHAVTSHLNAVLGSGTLTCLVGRNGVGKSTLLRTLTAFQPPLSGDVLLDGQPVSAMPRQVLAETIGVVLTERADMAGLTVWDVVAMGRSPFTNFWGRLTEADRALVDEAIEAVGLTALARHRMDEISDGERQKTMIAKALAQQTPVIILDEPTAFLDYPSKISVMQLLSRLAHEQHKIIFLSTHDLDVAYRLADELWLMEATGLTVSPTARQLQSLDFNPTNQ